MNKAEKFDRAMQLVVATGFTNRNRDGTGVCIASSLVVRDFLRELGFAAETKSVALRLTGHRLGELPRQIFVGGRDAVGEASGPGWDGHLVVTCKGLLIDPSFGQCRRPWWRFIPEVAVVPMIGSKFRERAATESGKLIPIIARMLHRTDEVRFEAVWASTPTNSEWKLAPAAKPERWRPIVDDMLDLYRARERERMP